MLTCYNSLTLFRIYALNNIVKVKYPESIAEMRRDIMQKISATPRHFRLTIYPLAGLRIDLAHQDRHPTVLIEHAAPNAA